MCRHNQVLGIALIAFGIGVLLGLWLEGGFICHCIGFGVLIFGCSMLRKK